MPNKKELRANPRYEFTANLQYRPASEKSAGGWKRGTSVNMSASGILINAAETLPSGSKWEVALDWPGIYHDKPAMRLFAIGTVVRCDSRGVAMRIRSHEFREVQREAFRRAVA